MCDDADTMESQWEHEWGRIAVRIENLEKAAGIAGAGNTYKGVPEMLCSQLSECVSQLEQFLATHSTIVPAAATQRFGDAVSKHSLKDHANTIEHLRSRLAIVVSLVAELNWELTDPAIHLEGIAERAFLHLSRLLAADAAQSARWLDEFQKTQTAETACERLGATHLLLHGIYAFKVDAGERTDLVLGNKLTWTKSLARAVEGLVLTEWKVVRDEKDAEKIAKQARAQAQLYTQGGLAGIALEAVRYVVLVSEKALPPIDDVALNGCIYRHINIAVSPDTPSVQSKKPTASKAPAKKASTKAPAKKTSPKKGN